MSVRVSVIVPVYNTEAHLERCLDSLANQTLNELEVLVVNDGSPDNSQEIIDRYAARYPDRIVPLIKENGGLSDARNFGIAHAKGTYLGFVDSDDWVDLDMYQRMFEHATETDSDIVVSPITWARPEWRTRSYFTPVLDLFGKSVADSPRLMDYANSFAWNKIYRRQLWLSSGIEFPVGQLFEDSAVIYNILAEANKVEVVNIPFYVYERGRDDAITALPDERVFDIFKSCDSILSYFQARPDYPELKEIVEFLCLRHIFARFDLLIRHPDRKLTRAFIEAVFTYLDTHLPAWRDNFFFDPERTPQFSAALGRQLRRYPSLAKFYYSSPLLMRKLIWWIRDTRRGLISSAIKWIAQRRSTRPTGEPLKDQQVQSKRIQANGYQLIAAVQKILDREGIQVFADFGTLLGLVREGRLLSHDLDIDLGVIIDDRTDIARIRTAMERFGFKIWREYYRGSEIVETSFRLFGVKLDINYYQSGEGFSRTWLFYRHPDRKYGPRDRSIVEMRYSPIQEFTTIDVNGTAYRIPVNAEQLLSEKYGESWRVPDKGWIYWQSPAATPIEDVGTFVGYGYIRGFARTRDFENEVLYEQLYRRELMRVDSPDLERSRMCKLQSLNFALLSEIDRVCREYDITYFLAHSTLLGAIRHQGFIPWDGTLDIMMRRESYERFLQIPPHAFGSMLQLQHWSLTPNFWSPSAQVRLISTSGFHQTEIEQLTSDNGPFATVFPLDSVPHPSSPRQHRQGSQIRRYKEALKHRITGTRPRRLTDKLRSLHLRFIPKSALFRRIDRESRILENSQNTYNVNLISHFKIEKETFPDAFLGEPRYVQFAEGKFAIPSDAESILRSLYGPNYMILPEIDTRRLKTSLTYVAS